MSAPTDDDDLGDAEMKTLTDRCTCWKTSGREQSTGANSVSSLSTATAAGVSQFWTGLEGQLVGHLRLEVAPTGSPSGKSGDVDFLASGEGNKKVRRYVASVTLKLVSRQSVAASGWRPTWS